MLETPEAPRTPTVEGKGSAGPPESAEIPARPFVTSFMEHLISKEIISRDIAEQLSQESFRQGKQRKTVVDALIQDFGVNSDLLCKEVARFYSFRILKLNEFNPLRLGPGNVGKILSELPENMLRDVRKYKVLPFEFAKGQPEKILIVSPNPSNREAYRVARGFPFKKFEICYMREEEWNEFWRQVGAERQVAISGLDTHDQDFDPDDDIDSMLDMEIHKGQLVALLDNIFTEAVRAGASDIHVTPKGLRKTSITFRIDGQLTEWYCIEDARAEAIVAVVKGRGVGLDRFERMAAQDGSAQRVVDGQTIRFRMSVLPVISRELGGKLESVVIRILKDADASVSLETIGFDSYSLEWFSESIARPHGMVILTGPTGCGKSTTLIAALRSVMKPTLNTITVEDPVEYLIEGARQ
ncbi:MAG: ATPase, T2SS/T4P/T4SS family, partial [Ignavibacteria bacterium]|nr:ATPase, T2SS/T4P/T4SS family [Ignavibacteria bacterium]